MSVNLQYMPLIIFSVAISAIAQTLLKIGAQVISNIECKLCNLFDILFRVSTNLYVISGISLYVFSVVAWLIVLSRVDVSYACPMAAIGYVLMMFIGYFVFGENISSIRIIGSLLIIGGVYCIGQS